MNGRIETTIPFYYHIKKLKISGNLKLYIFLKRLIKRVRRLQSKISRERLIDSLWTFIIYLFSQFLQIIYRNRYGVSYTNIFISKNYHKIDFFVQIRTPRNDTQNKSHLLKSGFVCFSIK